MSYIREQLPYTLDAFEGGELEFMSDGKIAKLKQGQAIFFASWLQHRVKPVTRGERKSLVMWFGGPSFK